MTKTYIGTKIVQAWRDDRLENHDGEDVIAEEGYAVKYPDGYQSWSPRATFEAAYRELSPEEAFLAQSMASYDGAASARTATEEVAQLLADRKARRAVEDRNPHAPVTRQELGYYWTGLQAMLRALHTADTAADLRKRLEVCAGIIADDVKDLWAGRPWNEATRALHAAKGEPFDEQPNPTDEAAVPGAAPRVTKDEVDELLGIADVDVMKVGEKTTLVTVKLPNGFELIESSACVSPENYDEAKGREICLERIRERLWLLEGYALQERIFHDEAKVAEEA